MPTLFNRTRQSESIVLKLLRQGRPLAVPIYWLVWSSDLGREGIENSGSYRFADHIYRNIPSGRGRFGVWLDKMFLQMPAVRSFRNRYLASRDSLCEFLRERAGQPGPLHILSAPCGIPRELADGARLFREKYGGKLDHVTFHGLDLDANLLEEARVFAGENGLATFVAHHGDAFDRALYPSHADFITCTGLAEFIDDAHLEQLYRQFGEILRPGGLLVTTGMKRVWVSEYFLRLAELKTHYRSASQLKAIAERCSFSVVDVRVDDLGIQSILTARK